jgi:hypothetical protein
VRCTPSRDTEGGGALAFPKTGFEAPAVADVPQNRQMDARTDVRHGSKLGLQAEAIFPSQRQLAFRLARFQKGHPSVYH